MCGDRGVEEEEKHSPSICCCKRYVNLAFREMRKRCVCVVYCVCVMKGSWGGGSQGELTLKANSEHADTKVKKSVRKKGGRKKTLHDYLREFFFHL